MKKLVLTYVEPKQDLKSKLNSICEACFWIFDESSGTLTSPFFTNIKVKQVLASLPTFDKKYLYENQKKLIAETKAHFSYEKNIIEEKIEELSNKENHSISNKTLEKELSELYKKADLIKKFIKNLDKEAKAYIKKTTVFNRERYVLHMYYPNVLTDSFKPFSSTLFSGQYLTFGRNIKFNLNYPFSVFNISEASLNNIKNKDKSTVEIRENLEELLEKEYPIAIKSLDTGILEKQKSLSFDFETKNWNKIRVLNNLLNVDKERLLEVAEALGCNVNELKWKNKGWIIREIQEKINLNKNESITIASVCNVKDGFNYLITTLDPGKEQLYVNDPIVSKYIEFKVIKVKNQNELIEKLNELVNSFEPLFIYGHNHLAFDLNIGKSLPEENIKLGVNYREPKRKFSVGNFRQLVINPGRVGIDLMPYSQQCMKNKDNTLDSVFEALFGLKHKSKKTLSHTDLIVETRKAEKGDKEAALKILSYAAMDSVKAYWNGEAVKREHIILAKVFNSLPERIDATSWKTLSNEYHTKRFYLKKGYFPRNIKNLNIRLSDKASQLYNKKRLLFSNFELSDFEHLVMQHYLKSQGVKRIKTEKGLKEGKIVKINPFISPFMDLLKDDKNLTELIDEYENSNEQKKLRLAYALEKILRLPVFMMLENNPKGFSEFFSYKINEKEFYMLKKELYNNLKKCAALMQDDNLINYSKDILFVNDNDVSRELIKNYLDESLVIDLGNAYALSGNKGVFIGKTDDWEFMFGFSSPKSMKGEKFPIESSFYQSFIDDLIFKQNAKEALYTFLNHLEYIRSSDFLSKLSMLSKTNGRDKYEPILIDEEIAKGNLTEEEIDKNLIIEVEAKRNFYDYSNIHSSTKKKAQQMLNAKKGDLIRYSYPKEVFLEKMLGQIKNNNKSNLSYSYNKGKMSRLIYWAFLEKNPDKQKFFDNLVNGTLDSEYLISLIVD